MAAITKEQEQERLCGIILGSTDNRVLLALRAAEIDASAMQIKCWLPHRDFTSITNAIYRMSVKGLVVRSRVHMGTTYYQLTEAGHALVNPKTGPLSRRNMARGVNGVA